MVVRVYKTFMRHAENIKLFCDTVAAERDSAHGAIQMILEKIRSHNTNVAIRAITVCAFALGIYQVLVD